jgi:hypothetical protein
MLFVNYELIRTYLYFLFSNDDSSIRNDSVIRAAPRSCLVDNIGACDDSDIGGHNTKQRDLESPQFQSDYSELLEEGKSSSIESVVAVTESLEEYRNTRLHFYYNLPSKATLTTFFYSDAPLLLEDRSKRNLQPVRQAIKRRKRKAVLLESVDTVFVHKRRAK